MIVQISRSVARIRPYLSLRSFDISTADGRARERQRRVFLSTIVAMFAKVISVGTQLVTIPITLNYLGAERFGLWMTISSVIAMLAFADLGIGNGLLNAVAKANGKDDNVSIQRYISSAALILLLISGVVLSTFALMYSFVPWAAVFNVHTSLAARESGPAAAAFVICFALNIPAGIVQRVQLGLQMGFIANFWQAAGSVLALVAILVVVHFQAGLHWLIFAFAGAPVITAAVNGAYFFGKSRPDLFPHVSLASKANALGVLRTGLLFFVLQIVVAVTYSSDNVIIAHALGASAVTTYAVPDKMFSVIPLLLSMILVPLWPAYGEAIARGDSAWVRRIFAKSLITSVLVALSLSLLFLFLGRTIMELWIGHSVDIPASLLAGFAIWKVIEAIGNTLSAYLNGANIVRIQVVVATVTGLTAIGLKFYLIRFLGVSGPIWATISCYSLFALVPYSIFFKKHFPRTI